MPIDTDTPTLPAVARAWTRAHVPDSRPATHDSAGAVVTIRDRGVLSYSSHPFTAAAFRPGAVLEGATCPVLLQVLEDAGRNLDAWSLSAPADIRGLVDVSPYMRAAKTSGRAYGLAWTRSGDSMLYTDSYIARVQDVPDAWSASGWYKDTTPIIVSVPACMRRDLQLGYIAPGAAPGLRYGVALAYSARAGIVLALAFPEGDLESIVRSTRAVRGLLETAPGPGIMYPLESALQASRTGVLPALQASGTDTAVRVFAADSIGASGDVLVDLARLPIGLDLDRVSGDGPIRPLHLASTGGTARAIVMPVQDRDGRLEMDS